MALRFKTTDREGGTSEVRVADGHVVTRQKGWRRLGGWYYGFSCTCGWRGDASEFKPLSNDVANDHAATLVHVLDCTDPCVGYDDEPCEHQATTTVNLGAGDVRFCDDCVRRSQADFERDAAFERLDPEFDRSGGHD